ncbi:hypothetical protein D3C87_1910860 [compost metagenome]
MRFPSLLSAMAQLKGEPPASATRSAPAAADTGTRSIRLSPPTTNMHFSPALVWRVHTTFVSFVTSAMPATPANRRLSS